MALKSYLKKRILYKPFIKVKPVDGLKMIVVIPAFNEPAIIETLLSLHNNDKPLQPVEVLVIINYLENTTLKIKEETHHTFKKVEQWMDEYSSAQLQFYCILASDLPKKHAGVGLARKIGMDEAVQRFQQLSTDGIITNLDADCTVSNNYLNAILKFYASKPSIQAANIHYEHPIKEKGTGENKANEAIILYELYLRYYIEALRFCKYPYAYHTVGSSFSVKSSVYQQQGGMNRRKAGEDFYFLHKIIPVTHFGEISDAVVYPSARESDRVPFGTGRSILEWHNQQRDLTLSYNLKTFQLIQYLFDDPKNFYTNTAFMAKFPEPLKQYLESINFNKVLTEIKNNTQTVAAFVKRYHRFWSGFELLKLVHYFRDHHYPNMPLVDSCVMLLKWREHNSKISISDPLELLLLMRRIQKKGI